MSNALYRRWRPRTFTDVVGQEHVTETLRASIREGRISHAYLFSGPRGTGKTSTARILAKALNCASGPTPDPCDTCESCIAINGGISLDVIEIDAASHGGVDDVRVLRENAVLAPALARKKVYIVDEAHMVSTAGWNAFLKTVEEPPDHIAFVFATTEPNKVLPTIVSRCQRFEFRRVSTAAIADHLGKICAEEGFTADAAALDLIARHSEGGVRDALSLLDQLGAGGSVTADVTRRLLGGAPTDILFDFTDALAARDTGSALRALAGIVDEGGDIRQFVRQVLEHLRALFVIQRVDDPTDLVDVTEETLARLTAQADRFRGEALVHALRLFADAQAEMRQQAPPRLTTEVAVVRATVPEADTTAEAALARIERLERLLDVGATPGAPARPEPPREAEAPAPRAKPSRKDEGEPPKKPAKRSATEAAAAAPPAPRPAAVGLVDLDKIKRDWSLVLEEVRKVRKSLHALLAEGRPRSLDSDELQLECRYEFHARQLGEARNAAVIAEALRSVFGVSLRIRTTLGDAPVEQPVEDEVSDESADPIDVLSSRLGAEVIEETED
ncbi:MAG: DNA polymerase III subunit gamma/tau [Actinomycetota bacterium]